MSPRGPIVSNSSPLIALDRIGQLELLHALLGEVVIPPAVEQEVFAENAPPPWIRVAALRTPLDEAASPTLGLGERQAIALAVEVHAGRIILDDLPARRLAASLGLPVIGTVGLLIAAKNAALVTTVAPLLDDLVTVGFRLSSEVVTAALIAAGER